jgi:hypothetical protein
VPAIIARRRIRIAVSTRYVAAPEKFSDQSHHQAQGGRRNGREKFGPLGAAMTKPAGGIRFSGETMPRSDLF